jgi:glycine cleavage system H protein
MTVPNDRRYTAEHEWIRIDGYVGLVGITEYAADALGDVVYVELPAVGSAVTAGQPCGEIESTKSVSELFAPVDGTVLEVNEAVGNAPEMVNVDPFGEGWLFRLRVTGTGSELLDAEAYAALTRGSGPGASGSGPGASGSGH